jgi:hypothetical protein
MRLFRQCEHGGWRQVFEAMAACVAPMAEARRAIAVPSAIGELIDKITILEIKAQRISDENKLRNIRNELALLEKSRHREGIANARLDVLKHDLAAINAQLWDIEDDIRLCEKNGDFGERFIALARGVYQTNDKRAALKREINLLFNSAVVEEKSYA